MIEKGSYKNQKGEEYNNYYYSPKSKDKLKDLIYHAESIYLRDYLPFVGRMKGMIYLLGDGRIVERFSGVGNVFQNFRHFCFWLIDSKRVGAIDTIPDKHKRKIVDRFKQEVICYSVPPQLGTILKASAELISDDSKSRRFSVFDALTGDVVFYDFLSDVFIVFPSIEEWNKVDIEEEYNKLIIPWLK